MKKRNERDILIRQAKMAKAAILFDKVTAKAIDYIVIISLIIVLSALFDMLSYSLKGINGVKFIDFDQLLRINPDTVAWLKIDNSHINHPVVQGRDNFEYLDKDFYGKYYAGGTLFLDVDNEKDFSDDYNIIHGHHMAGGAMFGDLQKYLDKDYFEANKEGVLLTPTKNYRLHIFGAGTVNAYNIGFYNVKADKKTHIEELKQSAYHMEDIDLSDKKILVLSTCTGDLNDTRTVVFCTLTYDPDLESLV